MSRPPLPAIVGAVLALTCLGCTPAAPAHNPSVTGSAGTAQPAQGAAKDLTGATCAADQSSGEWTFYGKLANNSSQRSNYQVRISVVKKEGATVVGSKVVDKVLGPGESAEIKVEKFAKPAEKPSDLVCIPTTTVRRG